MSSSTASSCSFWRHQLLNNKARCENYSVGNTSGKPKLLQHKPPKASRTPVNSVTQAAGGASATTSKTKWLLHPSLPVDVRVVGAGLLGAGGIYLYSSWGKENSQPSALKKEEAVTILDHALVQEEQQPQEVKVEEPPKVETPPAEALEVSTQESEAAVSGEVEEVQDVTETEAQAIQEDEANASLSSSVSEEEKDPRDSNDSASASIEAREQEEEVDPAQAEQAALVANLLQDVLTGKVVEDLDKHSTKEADVEVSTDSKPKPEEVLEQSVAEARDQNTAVAESAPLKESESSTTEAAGDGSVSLDAAIESGGVKESKASAVAAAEISQDSVKEIEAAPLVEDATEKMPPANLHAEKKIDFDLRKIGEKIEPQELVSQAVAKGEDPGEKWELYGAMHRQAAHDAEVFNSILVNLIAVYEEEIEDIIGDLKQSEASRIELERNLEDAAVQYKNKMLLAMGNAEVKKAEALLKQREDDLRTTASAMVRERQIRLRDLDKARTKLNSLKMAFSKRSNQARLSHDSHRLTRAVLSIKTKTEQGLPFAEGLDLLAPLAKEDDFIATVIRSIPSDVAKDGAMTNIQLQKWFWEVESAATKVALLPEKKAGILSHIVSHLASLLRMKEEDTSEAAGNSIESVFCVARGLISEGKFFESAALLEKHFGGTAAKAILGEWVKAARDRAIVDQAVMVLEATAVTKASSLS